MESIFNYELERITLFAMQRYFNNIITRDLHALQSRSETKVAYVMIMCIWSPEFHARRYVLVFLILTYAQQ